MYVCMCVCACIISPFFRRKSNMFHFFCWPPREFRISELDPYEASLAGSTRGYSRTPRNGWKLSFIQLQLESALFSSDPSGSPGCPFSIFLLYSNQRTQGTKVTLRSMESAPSTLSELSSQRCSGSPKPPKPPKPEKPEKPEATEPWTWDDYDDLVFENGLYRLYPSSPKFFRNCYWE